MDDTRLSFSAVAKAAMETSKAAFSAAFPTLVDQVASAARGVATGTPETKAQHYLNKASQARQARQEERQETDALIAKHKLKFQHVFPVDGVTSGQSVAYTIHKKNVVRFSIALCSPLDEFNRKAGIAAACRKFDRGQYTEIHVPHDVNVDRFMHQWLQLTLIAGTDVLPPELYKGI